MRRRFWITSRLRIRRRIVLLAVIVSVISLGAGTAYAYFTSTGSGTGSASTGTMQTVTVAATTGTPTTPLLPGGTGDVTLKVTNPNSYAVTLVSVAAGAGNITADSGHPGCTTTGVTFTAQTGLSTSIPGGGATTQVDLPGAAAMNATSSSGCQGATFTVPVTITVQK